MKRALLVSLLATAALAIPTASAEATMETTLCLDSSSPCASGSLYPGGHTFKATGTMIIGAGTIAPTCSSSIEFKTKTTTGLPLKAEVLSYTLTSCVNNGSVCSASSIAGAPFEVHMEWTSSSFNVVPAIHGSPPEYKFTCGAVACSYTAANPLHMSFQSGNPAGLGAEVVLELTSGKCSATAGTGIGLKFTSPTAVWLGHT